MQKYNRIVFVKTKMSLRRSFGAQMTAHTIKCIDSVLLCYRTVKRLLIPILQIRVRNGNFFCYFATKTYVVGT